MEPETFFKLNIPAPFIDANEQNLLEIKVFTLTPFIQTPFIRIRVLIALNAQENLLTLALDSDPLIYSVLVSITKEASRSI